MADQPTNDEVRAYLSKIADNYDDWADDPEHPEEAGPCRRAAAIYRVAIAALDAQQASYTKAQLPELSDEVEHG